jgi:hypothetical protein
MPRGTHPNSLKNLKPWKKGEAPKPPGRGTAGATLREWLNTFAHQELTERDLRALMKGKDVPALKVAAAVLMLRCVEHPDLADFADFIEGRATIAELREAGVDTALVKKAKSRTRTYRTKDGGTVTVTEREIELYDRSGEAFDRICDRAEGKPKHAVDLGGEQGMPLAVRIITPLMPGEEFEEPREPGVT